jgi:prophage regulatory protein
MSSRKTKKAGRQATVIAVPLVVSVRELPTMLSISKATANRMIARGLLPPRRQLSAGRAGWLRRELEEWLERLPVSAGRMTHAKYRQFLEEQT